MPITTCNSPETVRTELDLVRKKVTLDETEETWDTIAQGILHLTRLCNIGGCQFPSEMITGIRSLSRPLNSALNSERSRLSGAAVELVTALATGLGPSFDPLVSQLVPTLLGLCSRTNKVFTSRAKACIFAIIQHTHLPSILPYLSDLANHKSVFPRLTAAESILTCLNCFNPPDLEKDTRARIVEEFIKLTARDASADVRKASKEVFKAYKALMPARVDSFVAPLTPVVKKYLDIHVGPLGAGSVPVAGQKEASRPSSRVNKVPEVNQRSTTSTFPKAPGRPVAENPARSTKQRPPVQGIPTAADVVVPRQRTVSQMRRDPPPRTLHINVQSSGTAQRCAVPTSAPARQAVPHPAPSVARVLPAPVASSSKGPLRPPPAQMKFNAPPDRLKVSGTGAKRVPLPSVPVSGQTSGQVAATANSGDQTSGAVVDSRSKQPGRNAEPKAFGKSGFARKVLEGHRLASCAAKPIDGLASTAPAVIQRSSKPPVKNKANPSRAVPQRRPAGNVQKDARPLVNTKRKGMSPTLIPLPPSRPTSPSEVPLPPSPDCRSHPSVVRDEPAVENSGSANPVVNESRSAEPCQESGDMGGLPCTPITTLLASIQRGFLFTPSSPLSPPQNYLQAPGSLLGQDAINFSKGPLAAAAFCTSLDDNTAADGLDRHALKNLN